MERCMYGNCNQEFIQNRTNQKYCCTGCKKCDAVYRNRKKHNKHPKAVGRPAHRWVGINDMTEQDWKQFRENKMNKND